MKIGSIIKANRKQMDLTQEQLAEYLNVSVSAVSQWESGRTAPDLSLLVPMAEFFEISLDELFGRAPGEKDKTISEYNEKHDIFANIGDTDADILLWREALTRFPGDFHCMHMLASALFLSICACPDNDKCEKMANECLAVSERIIRDCKDIYIRESTIQTLVYLYSTPSLPFANEEKAVEYAKMSGGEAGVFSITLLEKAYYTDESREKRIRIKHYNRLFFLNQLSQSLVYDRDVSDENYLLALEAALKIWEAVISDGNYLFYHGSIAEICLYIAQCYAGKQKNKEALDYLEKALAHASSYDSLPAGEQHFSSPFVFAAASDISRVSKNYRDSETQKILKMAKEKFTGYKDLTDGPEYISLIENYGEQQTI